MFIHIAFLINSHQVICVFIYMCVWHRQTLYVVFVNLLNLLMLISNIISSSSRTLFFGHVKKTQVLIQF
jgi:hypothetical protein